MKTSATMTLAMAAVGIAMIAAGPAQAETGRIAAVAAARADNNTEGRMGGAQAATATVSSSRTSTSTDSADSEIGAAAAMREAPRAANK